MLCWLFRCNLQCKRFPLLSISDRQNSHRFWLDAEVTLLPKQRNQVLHYTQSSLTYLQSIPLDSKPIWELTHQAKPSVSASSITGAYWLVILSIKAFNSKCLNLHCLTTFHVSLWSKPEEEKVSARMFQSWNTSMTLCSLRALRRIPRWKIFFKKMFL